MLLNMTKGKFSITLALNLWSWNSRGIFLGLRYYAPFSQSTFCLLSNNFVLSSLFKTLTHPFLSPPSNDDDFTNKNEEQLGSWWWTGKPGVLQSRGLQTVGHDLDTEKQQQLCLRYPVFGSVFSYCNLGDNYTDLPRWCQAWLCSSLWPMKC